MERSRQDRSDSGEGGGGVERLVRKARESMLKERNNSRLRGDLRGEGGSSKSRTLAV